MKKFIYCFIMCMAIIVNTALTYANTDLFMEYHDYHGNTIDNSDTTPINSYIYGLHDASCFVRTTEYTYKNGVLMVKLRDAVNAMDGKIEYIPDSKLTKSYLPQEGQVFAGCSINSIAVQAGRNRIDYSRQDAWHPGELEQFSFYTTVTPQIINGSLYVGAGDLCSILTYNQDKSFMKDGKVYIRFSVKAA